MLSAPNIPEEYSSKRGLTTREKIILLEASKLNGHVFPPWQAPPGLRDFDVPPLKDVENMSLSKQQTMVFDGWRRAFSIAGHHHAPVMVTSESIDLVQDITTDCSIVASLCAASARIASDQSDVLMLEIRVISYLILTSL